jgi:hypothetical protein
VVTDSQTDYEKGSETVTQPPYSGMPDVGPTILIAPPDQPAQNLIITPQLGEPQYQGQNPDFIADYIYCNYINIKAGVPVGPVLNNITQINGISSDPQYEPPPNGWFCLYITDVDWGFSQLCAYKGSWAMRNGNRFASLYLYGYNPGVDPYVSSLAFTVDGGSAPQSSANGMLTFQHAGGGGPNFPFWIQNVNGELVFATGAAGAQPFWHMTASTGHFWPTPDNAIDIGIAGTNRIRNLFAAGQIQAFTLSGIGGVQSGVGGITGGTLFSGSGVPAAGGGNNGDFYFRTDTPGTANQRIYTKSAGAWVGIV